MHLTIQSISYCRLQASRDRIFRGALNRFYNWAIKAESHGLPEGYLRGAAVLDICCGNSAYLEKALHDTGAASITCLDIGDSWQGHLINALNSLEVDISKFACVGGSCTHLPFDDNSFDYVGAFGVLMHLETIDDIKTTLLEMNRVVKPGGYCYAYFGSGTIGVLDSYIHKALRNAYKENSDFKNYIDTLDVESLQQELESILTIGIGKDELITNTSIQFLKSLITLDTTTYFQNLLQVPVQQRASYDSEEIDMMIQESGGSRIHTISQDHYYERKDFRRFLTPFHLSRENSEYCRIMFGEGHIHRSWQPSK